MKEKFPIAAILGLLEKEEDFVFLDNARCDRQNFLSYLFLRPQRVVSTFKIDKIKDCFTELDEALKQGYYVAGFLSYEAGEAFEARLRHKAAYDFPLLWFGIYQEPLIYNHRKEDFEIKKIALPKDHKQKNYLLKNIRPNISQPSYTQAIRKIRNLIAQGLTYQVNYTFKLKFSFSGSPEALYFDLRNKQSVSYSAFIKAGPVTTRCNGAGPHYILSFSPELFFRKRKQTILARPMKGTIRRGRDSKEDSENKRQLESCLKNRSENVMIVDLLRNDLGRISRTGSVRVPRLFNVERYETLFQMTSDIQSRLKADCSDFDIFSHIFPSGSVTGAPKIKTIEIIKQLEKEPRNVYTGSIGLFSPKGCGAFNVAIRTLLIDSKKRIGEMGVGSGIVYDSGPKQEFAECRLKANFLVKSSEEFQLIETMLWRPNKGYLLLNAHLKRLENSARYFGFLYKRQEILAALARRQESFKNNPYRVRLLLAKDGEIKLESSLFNFSLSNEPRAYFSAKRTKIYNPFLYHKTTNRKIYDQQYQRCRRLGFYDVIFTNEKGEVTEGAISNIVIRKDGTLYTPPITSGLLNGVYREYLLDSKKYIVKEKVLFKKDLLCADEVYLSNSVRGLVKVRLEEKNH